MFTYDKAFTILYKNHSLDISELFDGCKTLPFDLEKLILLLNIFLRRSWYDKVKLLLDTRTSKEKFHLTIKVFCEKIFSYFGDVDPKLFEIIFQIWKEEYQTFYSFIEHKIHPFTRALKTAININDTSKSLCKAIVFYLFVNDFENIIITIDMDLGSIVSDVYHLIKDRKKMLNIIYTLMLQDNLPTEFEKSMSLTTIQIENRKIMASVLKSFSGYTCKEVLDMLKPDI